MGRLQARKERNKKLLVDTDNFIFNVNSVWENDVKNGMPDDDDHKNAFYKYIMVDFHETIINKGWCWIDLVTVLNLIRSKMIDFGKAQEFDALYNEYKPEDEKITAYNFGNWDFIFLFTFASHLIYDFQDIIKAIVNEHLNE